MWLPKLARLLLVLLPVCCALLSLADFDNLSLQHAYGASQPWTCTQKLLRAAQLPRTQPTVLIRRRPARGSALQLHAVAVGASGRVRSNWLTFRSYGEELTIVSGTRMRQ